MTSNFRSFFPIFANNPDLTFFDSAASAQKPYQVIEGVKSIMEFDYANIHRGAYELSERAEAIYDESKEMVKNILNARETAEINYTYNATYAFNLLSSSLRDSGILGPGDKVLLSIVEHHANIVPWLHLKEMIGIEVDFVDLDDQYQLDIADLERKLTPNVKVVSLTYASNVTGAVFQLDRIDMLLKRKYGENKPLFVVDASQAVPHFAVDVQKLNCDFLVFTGHKVMAETGIGVLYGKKEWLKKLEPAFCGGRAINWVHTDSYQAAGLPHRFEPGTPNIIGAASLLHAFRFIESIGGYDAIQAHETELMEYVLMKYKTIRDRVKLIGCTRTDCRTGIFSFVVPGIHNADLLEIMAEEGVALRAGHHCAEPYMQSLGIQGTLRMSLYLYNTREDVDHFFELLTAIIKKLG